MNGRQIVRCGVGVVLSLLLATSALAQAANPNAADDLQARLGAVAVAQQSGDPAAVATASKRVIALALRELGDVRANLGQFAAAAELCRRSLSFEDTAETQLSLAIAETRAGQLEEAVADTQKLLARDAGNATAWNLQGKIWMMKKEYAKAADSLEHSLALQNDPEVAYTMATALLNSKQNEKAAAVFEKLEAASDNSAQSHILVGRAYEGANLNAKAEEEYKKAVALDAKSSRGHYFLGLLYLEQNGWEPTPETRNEFSAEVALNPADFFGNYFMGYLASVDKSYAESDKYLQRAATARPDWPEPFLYMGLNAYGAGQDARAEELLRTAIRLTGKDEARNGYQIRRAYFTLGRILILHGKTEEGGKLVARSREMETGLVVNGRQQALDKEHAGAGSQPEAAPALTAGSAASAKVDPTAPIEETVWKSAALSESERAQLRQTDGQLRTILANAYNDLGASEARRRDYESALLHFHDAEAWNAKAPGLTRNLALAAFFSQNYAESARALQVVVTEDPSDQRARSMLALSLFSIKNYADAAKAFDLVENDALADPRMTYAWAVSLAKTHEPRRAATVLAKLVAQPIPPEMLALAGQVYDEIGDRKNAETCFQRAKEQDPNVVVPR